MGNDKHFDAKDDNCGFDRIINLTPEDFEEFERIMAEPPQPNDKLRELLRGYTIVSQSI